ncbi:MAG: PIN domain-containing protein [Candidatus Binatia bacterium]
MTGSSGATTLTTIRCLATKSVGTRAARGHIRTLLGMLEVAPATRAVLTDALDLDLTDYEDAVLHEAARHSGADGIVPRDLKGFAAARLKLYAPDELLRFLAAASGS